MTHDFETFPEKMFRLFGDKTFEPGSFQFEYAGSKYPIVSVCNDKIVYGRDGFYLKTSDATQFIVTDVSRNIRRIKEPVVIRIEDRKSYLEARR